MDCYNIILEASGGEITEKKSKFIADLVPITTKEEAIELQNQLRKKHFNARHHCLGYIVNGEVGYSDDGEPQGTAGKPILEVLKGAELNNVACVVTRYFGGVLLGTGGLVRAYTDACKDAVANAQIAKMVPGVKYKIPCEYTFVGKLQNLYSNLDIIVDDTLYEESVVFFVTVPLENEKRMVEQIVELSASKIVPEKQEECFYPAVK